MQNSVVSSLPSLHCLPGHCNKTNMLINVSFQYGTTALMVASYSGHYDCVKELIMQGADINYQREVCWGNQTQ